MGLLDASFCLRLLHDGATGRASMMSGFKNRIAPTLAALVMATSASVALTQPAVASDNVDNSSHKSMSENAR